MCTMTSSREPSPRQEERMSATADATAAPSDPAQATWRDPKRYAWPLGLLVPLLPFMAFSLVAATVLGVFWWFGPLFVFGVMPGLDTLIGKDAENPPDSVVAHHEQDRYYRW